MEELLMQKHNTLKRRYIYTVTATNTTAKHGPGNWEIPN